MMNDRIKQLENALQFYANPENWNWSSKYDVGVQGYSNTKIEEDKGKIARDTLEQYNEEEAKSKEEKAAAENLYFEEKQKILTTVCFNEC